MPTVVRKFASAKAASIVQRVFMVLIAGAVFFWDLVPQLALPLVS
jgi:hypothetical protein